MLLERTNELAAIEAAVERAGRGQGSCLVVEGPAGIGKSALLAAARTVAASRHLDTVTARAGQLEEDFPYGVVRQLFERGAREDGPRLLAGAAGLAATAFDLPVPGGSAESDTEFAITHGLYWMACNIVESGPLLVTVDDLHHCDAPSLQFLLYLTHRLEGIAIVVVAATRADSGNPLLSQLLASPAVEVLRPALLSPTGCARFVQERAGDEATPAFVAACHDASGGNPFLLSELLVAVRSDGLRCDDAAAVSVTTLTPQSVSRSVLLRLHGLPEAVVAVARAVGTLGELATLRHVAVLAGVGPDEAMDLCDGLVRAGVLAPGRPLRFVHPMIGEAIRDDTPVGERVQLHRRAARLLADEGIGADHLAPHLVLTDELGDAWVTETLRHAARTAQGRGATDTAARWLRRAVAEGVFPPPKGLLRELGEAEWLTGDAGSAIKQLEAAVRGATDPEEMAQASVLLARVHASMADTCQAAVTIRQVLQGAPAVSRPTALQLEAEAATYDLLNQVDVVVVRQHLMALVARAEGTEPGLLMLCSLAATCLLGGSAEDAVGFARRGLEGGRLLDEGAGSSFPFLAALTAFSLAENQEEAGSVLDAALEHARARGSTAAFTYACGTSALAAWTRGDLRRCEQMTREAIDPGFPPGYAHPILYSYLALVLTERGTLAAARDALAQSGFDEGLPLGSQSVHAAYAMGHLLRAEGRVETALGVLRAQGEDPRQPENFLPHPPWRLEAALCLVELGEPAEAGALAEEHMVHAARWGTTGSIGATMRIMGLATLGDDRIPRLQAAEAMLAQSPARLEHAYCLADLGVAMREAGRSEEARAALRAAYEGAGRCTSSMLAERARYELMTVGVRPRRHRLTGVESLTASERRVCDLAVRGLSNAQVAQSLFVTRSTIEKHLSHAYDKLAIGSREELARVLPGE